MAIIMLRSSAGSIETPSRFPWVALIYGAKISRMLDDLHFFPRKKWLGPESAIPISSVNLKISSSIYQSPHLVYH